jgi:hypothetical protein
LDKNKKNILFFNLDTQFFQIYLISFFFLIIAATSFHKRLTWNLHFN